MSEKTLVSKIQTAIETCHDLTKPMRAKREQLLNEYASGWYDEVATTKKPLNMVFRAMSIIPPLLAAKNPRAMIRPRIAPLLPFGETFRLALNHLSEEIKLGQTLRQAVIDSMMYMGITKTGLTDGGPKVEDALGYLHDAGQLYCDCVDGTDYVFDVVARKKEEMDFEGNRYRVPLDYITDSGIFQNYDKLSPTYGEYGQQAKRPERKAKRNILNFSIQEIRPYVEIYDVWIPAEDVIITIPSQGQGDKPLRIVEWQGPEDGPYDLLYYHIFPESIIPIPPIWAWLDLHHFINTLARKMARRSDREKTILAYTGTAEEDATTVKEAEDNEVVRVDDVNSLKEISFGGNTEDSYNFMQWLKMVWSEQSGNLDLISGVKTQANTLGQEQMLYSNATTTIDDMINQVHNFSKSIFRKFGWYAWTDPLMQVSVTKRVAGIDLDVYFSPESKEGDFIDYNIDIEPYSSQRTNPLQRMRRIMEIVTGVILPTADIAAMQGDMLQIRPLVKSLARDLDLTDAEIDEFYKNIVQPPSSNMGPYQLQQGIVTQKSPMATDQQGASDANKMLNSVQQQNRAGMRSSPPQTSEL